MDEGRETYTCIHTHGIILANILNDASLPLNTSAKEDYVNKLTEQKRYARNGISA